jgi:acetyl esterase
VTISVDPHMRPILDALRAGPAVDLRALPIREARALFEAQQTPWAWCPVAMAGSRELSVPGVAGLMRARLHLPVTDNPLPLIIFVHGGGWTFGSIDTHDGTMRILAAVSGCAVLGIDYRLAPEHPFPAPLDDVLAALAFARSGALGAAVDPGRIALCGDSAGANLCLGAMTALRDRGCNLPLTAALIYGCYAPLFDTPSHKRLGDGSFMMRTEMMRWYWANFLGAMRQPAADAAPLHARLGGLPPLYLSAAGLDPLLDDTILLSEKLAEEGIRHRVDIWPGVTHGFVRLARDLPLARQALKEAGDWLADHLDPPSDGGQRRNRHFTGRKRT